MARLLRRHRCRPSCILTVVEALALLVPLLIGVAYLTYAERKVLAAMQLRKGPNVVGPFGLLQPFADALKMLMKETIIPAGANRAAVPAGADADLRAGADRLGGDPGDDGWAIADINVGILYLFAISSLGVYGIIIAGWATNSKYAFLGALRSRGADGQLRGLDGLRHGHRAAVRRQPEPDRHRAGAAERVVLHPAVPDVHRVLHLGAGRDQPRAVRPAGRRERDRRRLLRRIHRR